MRQPNRDAVEKIEPDGSEWLYHWNGAGMLTEVERPDGKHVGFEYDVFARRTKKVLFLEDDSTLEGPRSPAARRMQDLPPWEPERIIESETRFVWDGHNVLHEVSSDSGLTTWYWEPGTFTPVAKERGKNQWSLVSDHLGTPTEMYDEQGQLFWQMELNVFGEASFGAGESSDCPWRWPGQYEDGETGLIYNHWRYFASDLGVYIASDPLGLDGGLRDYGYVRDPLTLLDPLGLIERFFRFVTEAEARQSAGNLGGDNSLHPRTHRNRQGGVTESRGPKWITQAGSPERLSKTRPPYRLDIEADDGTQAWFRQH